MIINKSSKRKLYKADNEDNETKKEIIIKVPQIIILCRISIENLKKKRSLNLVVCCCF